MHSIEFKSQIPSKKDILHTLIAFGNNVPHGGKLVLGVEDKKDAITGERPVKGFTITDNFVTNIQQRALQEVNPLLEVQFFKATYENKNILVIDVRPGNPGGVFPYVLKSEEGKTWFRDGSSTQKYNGLQQILARIKKQEKDITI